MKLPRRTFLHLAAGAAALPAVSRIARAEAYPSRAVRSVVGLPPAAPLTERLAQLGIVPTPMTPTEFGKFIADETEKWGKVVKFADMKPE